jgi:hypothetical protein
MKPTVSLMENVSRKPELVQEHQVLRLPTSGQTYVGGTWMSVNFSGDTNAVKHAFEPLPSTAGLVQELQARLARWRTVEASSTNSAPQQQKLNDPAD